MTLEGRSRGQRLFWSIVVVYAATWVFIAWLTSPSLDPYGDMVENYAWSQTTAWGTFKHPPLIAWVVGAWFALLPTQPLPYYVLSYTNAVAGALGVVALARLFLPTDVSPERRDAFSVIVLLLTILSFPFSNLALKFNTDTILLSLWPWTTYAFFAAIRQAGTRRHWRFPILFAVMAAAAMLGKYYSALLLAALAASSLAHRDYRRWYRTPQPYVAAILVAILLLPHLNWELQAHFPFRNYLETKIDSRIDPVMMIVFLLSAFYYLPCSWLAWLVLRRRFANAAPQPIPLRLPVRGLVLVTVLPALFTVAANAAARVHLTTHWAIPVWFGLPALLALALLPTIGDDFRWQRLTRSLATVWAVVLIGVAVYTAVLSAKGDPRYSLARRDMVRTVMARFADREPSQALSWAGGSWPETGALAFFAPSHPRALPGLPDDARAQANPYADWQDRYGVILCYAAGDYARRGSRDEQCERSAREWLRAHQRPIAEETLTYRADGWRFLDAQEKSVTVFWVAPRAGSPATRRG